MNSYYEFFRDNANEVYFQVDKNPKFPQHFHAGIEVFILKEGFFTVSVGGESLDVTSGSVVVFDSYEIHSYDAKKDDDKSAVLLIPYEFRKFIFPSEKHKIQNHIINDYKFTQTLLNIVETFIVDNSKTVQNGAVFLICALLKEKILFTKNQQKEDADVLKKILIYVTENYTKNVSRKKISLAIGYSESYISHVFNDYLKISITDFANLLRFKHVENEIKNGNGNPISVLIFEAGFKSQQTYYRVKSKFKSK